MTPANEYRLQNNRGTKPGAPRFASMTQHDNRSATPRPNVISTVRARGATLRGPTLAILLASLAIAALAMAVLLTKFYAAGEPRRVFNLNGVEVADRRAEAGTLN